MGKISKSATTLYELIKRDWEAAGWPVPASGLEAVRAAELIYRHERNEWPFMGRVKLVTGNRHTWVHQGVLYINPDRYAGELQSECGWAGIVHGLGHWIHHKQNPKMQPHCPAHARLERRLQRYVLDRLLQVQIVRNVNQPVLSPDTVRR